MNILDYKEDYPYAASRLEGTWVKNPKGEGLACVDVIMQDDGQVEMTGLIENKAKNFSVHLSELDLTPPKLGFSSKGDVPVFVSRKPSRHMRAGLCSSNISLTSLPNSPSTYSSFDYFYIGSFYEKPVECLEQVLCEEAFGKPFSNDFCFAKGEDQWAGLWYRTHRVGRASLNIEAEQVNFQLFEDYSFLEQLLEENLNGTRNS